MFTIQVLDNDNKPVKGAVCLIDSTTETVGNLPHYSGDDGKITLDGLADGDHTFEVHIEGQHSGVRFTFTLPYPKIFVVNFYLTTTPKATDWEQRMKDAIQK